jgi:hypothetical protein
LKTYVERRPAARTLFNAFHAFKTLFKSARASALKKTLAAENRTEAVNLRVGGRGASPHSISSMGDFGAETTVSVENQTDPLKNSQVDAVFLATGTGNTGSLSLALGPLADAV